MGFVARHASLWSTAAPCLIFLDTETTGKLLPRVEEIAAIDSSPAAVDTSPAAISTPSSSIFHELVSPGRHIEPGAVGIHGITDERVVGAPTFASIWTKFVRWVQARAKEGGGGRPRRPLIITYNGCGYDYPVVIKDLQRYGLALPSDWLFADWALEQRMRPGCLCRQLRLPYVKLAILYEMVLGKPLEGAHSAVEDTRGLMDVYIAARDRYQFCLRRRHMQDRKALEEQSTSFFGIKVKATDGTALPDHFPLRMICGVGEKAIEQAAALQSPFPIHTIADLRRAFQVRYPSSGAGSGAGATGSAVQQASKWIKEALNVRQSKFVEHVVAQMVLPLGSGGIVEAAVADPTAEPMDDGGVAGLVFSLPQSLSLDDADDDAFMDEGSPTSGLPVAPTSSQYVGAATLPLSLTRDDVFYDEDETGKDAIAVARASVHEEEDADYGLLEGIVASLGHVSQSSGSLPARGTGTATRKVLHRYLCSGRRPPSRSQTLSLPSSSPQLQLRLQYHHLSARVDPFALSQTDSRTLLPRHSSTTVLRSRSCGVSVSRRSSGWRSTMR
jgi:DNA polymerase III epsilon subunit-like protein